MHAATLMYCNIQQGCAPARPFRELEHHCNIKEKHAVVIAARQAAAQ
jgi:hypothetical protein